MTRRRNSIIHLKDYRKLAPRHVQSIPVERCPEKRNFFNEGIILLVLILAGVTSLQVLKMETHEMVEKIGLFHQQI